MSKGYAARGSGDSHGSELFIYGHAFFLRKHLKGPPPPLGGERPVPHTALWAELGLLSREKARLEPPRPPPGYLEELTHHPKCEVLTPLHSAKPALLALLQTPAISETPRG